MTSGRLVLLAIGGGATGAGLCALMAGAFDLGISMLGIAIFCFMVTKP